MPVYMTNDVFLFFLLTLVWVLKLLWLLHINTISPKMGNWTGMVLFEAFFEILLIEIVNVSKSA